MIDSKWVRQVFTRVRVGFSQYGVTPLIVLKDIDDMIRIILRRRTEINRKVKKTLENELDLAYLYIIATALLLAVFPGIALAREKEVKGEPQWQRCYRFVTHAFLLQLTNFGLSTLRLIEDGQDNAARVLVRATSELTWQTLICLAKDDYLTLWLEGDAQESATHVWNELFRGKMSSILQEIEKQLGTPDDVTKQLMRARIRTQKFYSQAVHHSFAATVFGSLGFSLDYPAITEGSAIFGAASDSLRNPLAALNDTFFYFYFLMPRVVKQIRGYPIPANQVHWKAANALIAICALIHNELASSSDAEQRVQPNLGDAARPSAS